MQILCHQRIEVTDHQIKIHTFAQNMFDQIRPCRAQLLGLVTVQKRGKVKDPKAGPDNGLCPQDSPLKGRPGFLRRDQNLKYVFPVRGVGGGVSALHVGRSLS